MSRKATTLVRNGGSRNKLRPQDRAAHDWYRFVLSFPPHLVREYVERFDLGPDDLVLDPFCGTGTTLVECKKLGIPSVVVEANPMAWFATQVKVDWTVDPDGLLHHAHEVAAAATARMEADGFDDFAGLPLFRSCSNGQRSLLDLPPEADKL